MSEREKMHIADISLSDEFKKAINLCNYCDLKTTINDTFSNDNEQSLCSRRARYKLSFKFEEHSIYHKIEFWKQKEAVDYITKQYELYCMAKNILSK